MTCEHTDQRPDAASARSQWRMLRGQMSILRRGVRLRLPAETAFQSIVLDVLHLFDLFTILVRRLLRTLHR